MKKQFISILCLPLLSSSAFGGADLPRKETQSCPWAIAGLAQLQVGIVPFHFAYHGSGAEFFFATQRQKEYKLQGREVELLTDIFATGRSWLPDGSYELLDIGPGNGQKAAHVAKTVRPGIVFSKYVPVDSSESVLEIAQATWKNQFPIAGTESVRTDFEINIPIEPSRAPKLALFIGQTLGNVSDRAQTLKNIRNSLSNRDRLMVGVELLHEDTPNELGGYSSATNLEIYYTLFQSMGISRENLRPDVRFNTAVNDFEMGFHVIHPFSIGEQEFKIGQSFKAISHRFTLPELHSLLTNAGFGVEETFTDPKQATALVVARPL